MKYPTWRTKMLARPKYYTPKVVPIKVERIVDLPKQLGSDGLPLAESESNLRIPPRVLMAALPYERVLQATNDQFNTLLPHRHKKALEKYLKLSKNSMYQRLVKRPICTGVQVTPPPPREMELEDWQEHRQRILKLSQPRKDLETPIIPQKKKPLSELMPRILQLSALQNWKIELMKQVEKDITKVHSKALLYTISPRMEDLAKPKKVEDQSVEGTLRKDILEKFDKKLDNVLLKRRAASKLNYKRV